MGTKLHVGNIPPTVFEDDLQATFAKFGPVDTVEIARDSGTGWHCYVIGHDESWLNSRA